MGQTYTFGPVERIRKTMFDKNFFPTPVEVIEQMGIFCHNKVVLEPQAGKGNIVEWLKSNGAKEVIACEKNEDLAEVIQSKCKFLGYDFLKVNAAQISHVNLIVMNPPFSNADRHLLHAWEIAAPGSEIISLINSTNLENDYSYKRKQLRAVINDYGTTTDLGNCFQQSERKTSVNIALVKLYKPNEGHAEFDGFFMEEEEEEEGTGSGIMKFNAVRDVVQRYVNAVKCFDEHLVISQRMNSLTDLFKVGSFSFEIGYNKNVCTKEDFKKEIQKKAWEYLFDKMDLEKYVTSGVMKNINKFVENQQNVPFTMRNIYKMFEIIIGTREENFNKSLVEAVDHFTKHIKENRFAVEGWVTNSGHMINKKFIVPYIIECGFSGQISERSSGYSKELTDLLKVLCSITGTNYDHLATLRNKLYYRYKLYQGDRYIAGDHNLEAIKARKHELWKEGVNAEIKDEDIGFGKWMDWGFFEIKGFKKGTLHLKFKDEQVWRLLNQRYAKIKGMVLPENI